MARKLSILCLLVMLVSCKRLARAVSFEGEIEMGMSSSLVPGPAMTTVVTMKGDRVRTEWKGTGTATIMDGSSKKTYVLDPSSKSYTEIDLSAATVAAKTSKAAPPKVTKMGKSDTVAGYPCEVYVVEDSTSRIEVCAATGMSLLAFGLTNPFATFMGNDDSWASVFSKGFPLRVAVRDPSGAPLMKIEATRVDRKSIPDSEFEIPAGFTKRSI